MNKDGQVLGNQQPILEVKKPNLMLSSTLHQKMVVPLYGKSSPPLCLLVMMVLVNDVSKNFIVCHIVTVQNKCQKTLLFIIHFF